MGNYCYGENLIYEPGMQSYKIMDMKEQAFFNSQNFSQKSVYNQERQLIIFGDSEHRNFIYDFNYARKKFIPLIPPQKIKFYNYSGTIQKNKNTLIVCGGIQHNLVNIQKKCFEIDIQTLQIKVLPNMIDFRYTFPIIYFNDCIFVIGGRQYGNDNVSILKKCEKFDYKTNKWTQIAEMNIQRCTHSAFVYNKEIWAIGGYTGRFSRSKKVEKYNIQDNEWQIVDFQLNQGFENGVICSTKNPNEILILGGKKNYGQNQSCWLYNLQTNTVINRKPLQYSNIIPKFNCYGENDIVILSEVVSKGLNRQDQIDLVCEVYNKQNFLNYSLKLQNYPDSIKKMKQNNCNMPQITIQYTQQDELQFLDVDYTKQNIIFGTDDEPFQLEINQDTAQIKVLPIPTKLQLQNFQGVCRISSNELFFAGGINSNFKKIFQRAFIYNLQTRQIQKIDSMFNFRYTFPIIKFKNYVYAIGGREYGANNVAIMSLVERFNLVTGKWEQLQPLNIPRCTSNTFVYRNQLFVAGGFTPDNRTDTIEIFIEQTKQWMLTGINLNLKLEASVFVVKDDNVFYFGGRAEKKGDQYSICKVMLKDKDFGQSFQIGKFKHKMCLHKLVYVKDYFLIFGNNRLEFNLIDSQKFKSVKKFKHNPLNYSQNSDSSIRYNCSYEYFCNQLKVQLNQISFQKDRPKKSSFVDSYTNINQFIKKIYSINPLMFLYLNYQVFTLYSITMQTFLIFFIIILLNKLLKYKIKIQLQIYKIYNNNVLFFQINLYQNFNYLYKLHIKIFYHYLHLIYQLYHLNLFYNPFHIKVYLIVYQLSSYMFKVVFQFNLPSIKPLIHYYFMHQKVVNLLIKNIINNLSYIYLSLDYTQPQLNSFYQEDKVQHHHQYYQLITKQIQIFQLLQNLILKVRYFYQLKYLLE